MHCGMQLRASLRTQAHAHANARAHTQMHIRLCALETVRDATVAAHTPCDATLPGAGAGYRDAACRRELQHAAAGQGKLGGHTTRPDVVGCGPWQAVARGTLWPVAGCGPWHLWPIADFGPWQPVARDRLWPRLPS